jgi:SH3-like domain-containing protein
MKVRNTIGRAILSMAALLAPALMAAGPAIAQEVVSVRSDGVNMRAAPSMQSDVLWQLGKGYPLKVVGRKGTWLNVVDFENDRGWVASRLTTKTPHAIVKSSTANIRSGPGTTYRVAGKAGYGDVFQVHERQGAWVRVEGPGTQRGWISRQLLWGG